jgi:hypothetical protein
VFRQVRAAVSVTPYILCGADSCIQLSPLLPLTHCLSILFIAFPMGPEDTALSVNAAPYEGRQLASGTRPPNRVLRHGPGLSLSGILLEGLRDTLRSLPGSTHRPVLQGAPAR